MSGVYKCFVFFLFPLHVLLHLCMCAILMFFLQILIKENFKLLSRKLQIFNVVLYELLDQVDFLCMQSLMDITIIHLNVLYAIMKH